MPTRQSGRPAATSRSQVSAMKFLLLVADLAPSISQSVSSCNSSAFITVHLPHKLRARQGGGCGPTGCAARGCHPPRGRRIQYTPWPLGSIIDVSGILGPRMREDDTEYGFAFRGTKCPRFAGILTPSS